MIHGKNREYLETIYEETGQMPEPLLRRPSRLSARQQELYNAYSLLSPSRPVGEGAISGITTTDILTAAEALGFEPEPFLQQIRDIDSVFLKQFQKKMAEATEKNKRTQGHGSKR